MVLIRQAKARDLDRLIEIRAMVRENRLRDPLSVTRDDYLWFVGKRLIWVAEAGGQIAGFSAGDPRDGTIWALFVDPACEGSGLGAQLLARACGDLQAHGFRLAHLFTDPETKAARLYGKLGWQALGLTSDGEMQFQLSF